MRLERLPYTLNGKLDRDALKRAVDEHAFKADYAAPETNTEHKLAQTWQRILNERTPIGRDERFFERGGDSLAAMQLQAAIRIEWRVNLRLDTLFDDPSLAELATLIDRSDVESGPLEIAARKTLRPHDSRIAPHRSRSSASGCSRERAMQVRRITSLDIGTFAARLMLTRCNARSIRD